MFCSVYIYMHAWYISQTSILLWLGWDLLHSSGECPLPQFHPYYWRQEEDWHHPMIVDGTQCILALSEVYACEMQQY